LPAYVALTLCYISWSNKAFQLDGTLAQAVISHAKTLLCAGKLGFLPHDLPPPSSLDYSTLGVLQVKGKTTAHPKLAL
jgi:hypothetical protein